MLNNSNIVEFHLSCGQLGTQEAQYISEGISKNKKIQELRLSGCKIGPNGSIIVFEGLILNYTITRLYL